MSTKSPSWLAGYQRGLTDPDCIVSAIVPPDDYDQSQRGDYVVGYCIGARDARDNRLIDEITAAQLTTPTKD